MRGRERRMNGLLSVLESHADDGVTRESAIAWIVRTYDVSSLSAKAMIKDMSIGGLVEEDAGRIFLTEEGAARLERVRADAEEFLAELRAASPARGPAAPPPPA